MIARMRTISQAATVAAATGGIHVPARLSPAAASAGDPTAVAIPVTLTRMVDIGPDLEAHRPAVETVSTLFETFTGTADTYAATGDLGTPAPSGWGVTAAQFEVHWPDDPAVVRSHFGARRYAFNWALATVKADMDARTVNPDHSSTPWTLAGLRKRWNSEKDDLAPWWPANSKEAYSCGIDDLVRGPGNWSASRSGTRAGAKAQFPRFKSARRDRGRVRFTTGAMRLEADRRTITVPVIGALRSKENTRRVQRHLASGRARILNLTVTERWGRLFVSVNYALREHTTAAVPHQSHVRAGVDLGLRDLAAVATVDRVTGAETVTVFPNPAPLRASLAARRRAGTQISRRIPGSRGHRAANAKLTRLDRRCVHLRREASHQLTTVLARRYGEVVVEDLDLAAMKRGMGRRAFRRSVSDAALGAVRPQLAYKCGRTGSVLTVADRWFPSSQLHHGCTGRDGQPCRLGYTVSKLDKHLVCPVTAESVDRDVNAARNLRDWPDMPVDAQSVRRSRTSAVPPVAAGTSARTAGVTCGLGSACKTSLSGVAVHGETRTEGRDGMSGPEELRKECG